MYLLIFFIFLIIDKLRNNNRLRSVILINLDIYIHSKYFLKKINIEYLIFYCLWFVISTKAGFIL